MYQIEHQRSHYEYQGLNIWGTLREQITIDDSATRNSMPNRNLQVPHVEQCRETVQGVPPAVRREAYIWQTGMDVMSKATSQTS